MLACSLGLTTACSQPSRNPEPPAAATAKPETPSGTPRIGTVTLVRELKERGLTTQNWLGVVGSIFNNDTEKDVIRTRYEVTVLFRDGTQNEMLLDRNPGVTAGQRVRVTGDRIEALDSP